MSQTILIIDDENLKKLYTLNLEALIGAEVICLPDAQSALNLLSILPEIPLVITQVKTVGEPTAQLIHDFIQDNILITGMIVIGECAELADSVTCLKEPVDVEQLLSHVAPYLGIDEELSMVRSFKRYVPVSLHCFYEITEAPCDIYIKIKRGENANHYIKRLHANDSIDIWDVERYSKLGLTEFYILNYDIRSFTIFVSEVLIEKLKKLDVTFEEAILTNGLAHQLVRDTVQMSGLNGEAIQLSEASINKMVSSVLFNPDISDLLMLLMSERINCAYRLCHLQSLICHYMLMKQSWYQVSHLETLSFVSYFHQITIVREDLLLIKNRTEIVQKNLTTAEREQLLNLPQVTLKVMEDHPRLDAKARAIFLESNGVKNGSGMEDDPDEELGLLTKVFIIASTFVKILLDPDLPSTKIEILEILNGRFTQPSYQKIIKALEQRFS